MICRLLRNFIIAVTATVGIAACIQDGGIASDSAASATNVAAKGSKLSYFRTTPRGYNQRNASASGVVINASIIESPGQMLGAGGSLWDRLRKNFQLPPAANRPQVQAQIKWFTHNQTYLDRTIKRAAPYMYLIFQETQSRNLPGELVLLPIMESAYNPFIRSSRGAVGLWQLMSGTANVFGVKQDFWYDGRRDIYASTNAALDYLTYLQSYFGGDWLLAIAAYDAGEGRLQSAVRHNAERGLTTDFWSLSLPVETQAYVPRLLALAAIIQNPAKYNVTLPPVTDQPYLQQVDLGAPINLTQVAGMASMSLAELKALNPGYSRATTGPNGPYRLLLPIDRIAIFKERLAAMPALTKTTWGHYKVRSGDTLNSIADQFDSSMTELRSINHLKSAHVPTGRVIMVPMDREQVTPHIYDLTTGQKTSITSENVVAQAASVAASQAPAMSDAVANAGNNEVTATTTKASSTSADANNKTTMVATSTVTADETVDEATTDTDDTDTEPSSPVKNISAKTYHVIKHGETLSTVARNYGVTVNELQRWNKLKAGKILKPGTRLIIYRASTGNEKEVTKETTLHRVAPAAKTTDKNANVHADAKPTHYTVHAGDNLIKIANRYNVKVVNLRKWNHLAENAVVKPGQKLVIYTEG